MTWFKGDDSITNHPKFQKLRSLRGGKQAQGDWLHAACWCAGQLSDGLLPEVTRKALGISRKSALLLTEVGLWEEASGGWQFHDWTDHNASREDILRKRAKSRASSRRNRPSDGDPSLTTAIEVEPDRDTDRDLSTRESIPRTHSLTVDQFGAYEHMGAWFFDRGEVRPSLVGKALDEFAARVAVIANAHECTLETAVYRLCAAAHASGDKFVWAVRDCPVPKPVEDRNVAVLESMSIKGSAK